jgi:hypothetical protein
MRCSGPSDQKASATAAADPSAAGSVYGTLLSFNIDVPWLMRWHTGNFGVGNLQPVYAPLLGDEVCVGGVWGGALEE